MFFFFNIKGFFFQMFKPLGDLYYFTIPQGGVVIYPFIFVS